jgi:inosine/xanthosine triphosphatase
MTTQETERKSRINVGSTNITKIQAVKDAVALYPNLFPNPEVIPVDVSVEQFGHPKSLTETIEGAIARAKQAFTDCDYSFGLEGGLMEVPYSKTGYMEVGACALFDGENIHLGLSPAYEWPIEITKMILSEQADASSAFKKLGYTEQEKLGAQSGGIIGALTEGRMNREDFTKYSIIMALIQLEKPEYYK